MAFGFVQVAFSYTPVAWVPRGPIRTAYSQGDDR
jgi:hypothetical protein